MQHENGSDREIELKIIRLGDKDNFISNVLSRGGILTGPWRLLTDYAFRPISSPHQGARGYLLDAKAFADQDKLKRVLDLLGVSWALAGTTRLHCTYQNMLERTVRLRIDDNRKIFTVKEKRLANVRIDNRIEIEVDVHEESELRGLIQFIHHDQIAHREKYRTSYQLNGCLVELNEAPRVPAWAEIEGPSEEKVFEMIRLLGYTVDDTAAISDPTYFELCGIPPQDIPNLRF